MVRNPEVHRQVCAELQDLPSPYKGEDLAHLPYFNAAIKETLRLYGAALGGLPRIVPLGGRKSGGYFIPEGVTVTTQAYTLHRDPNIFDEPNNFKPARWLSPTPQTEESFMPFGAGPRICIGLHLAHLELSLVCAGFLREFPNARVSNETPDSDMAIENYFLIAPKGHRCLFCIWNASHGALSESTRSEGHGEQVIPGALLLSCAVLVQGRLEANHEG